MNTPDNIRLKVCGMRDRANILEVGSADPDYMGFIFYAPSKRAVVQDFALPDSLPKTIKTVAVFVNESNESIVRRASSFDFIQLHGEETPEQCAELRNIGMKIIKAFSVGESFEFESLSAYKTVADYFLFDTKGPGYGGSGKVFDWNLLDRYDQEVPFFLGGGLTLENIKGLGKLVGMNIHAIDVNSGVELSPGLKNVDEVKRIKEALFVLNNGNLNKRL